LASCLSNPSSVADTEHFLTSRGDVARHFQGKKRYLMESFYRQMRRRHDILVDNGKPVGGKWNYDQSNRRRYDGAVPVPEAKRFANDVSDIVAMIHRCQVPTFGRIDPQRLIWPVTRRQALSQLQDFIEHRLLHFGTYQDAMTSTNGFLFHSLLSFALNTKMLHPMEVIQAAIACARSASGQAVSIEQLEGFVRQILGWREYMRGIYWARMPDYASLNHFGHTAGLPDFYWTAETRMNCLHTVISHSLTQAYAHHIQRLMITGNFALLAGIDPDEVDRWYLGIYMDAVQWVEIVNTRGMSQYADGGLVATKPYISSANYIHWKIRRHRRIYASYLSSTRRMGCAGALAAWSKCGRRVGWRVVHSRLSHGWGTRLAGPPWQHG
jgi:deoxyribodipyrimidine photolyase-related protein